MSEYDYTFSFYTRGTSKQARKFRKFKEEYNNKKDKILNIRELLKNNKRSMAKKCIDSYLSEHGEDGYILHELGKYYCINGNIDEAKKYYEKVIIHNYKNKYYSMYELAKIEKYKINYDEAIKLLNEIIESDHEEKCHARLERAKIYYIMNKYDEFLDEVTKLILNNEPNKNYAFDALMDYCVDFYDSKIALKMFNYIKRNLKQNEKDFYMAIIFKLQNKPIKSKAVLENIASSDSEFKYRAKYHLAILSYESENYLETIELADNVCEHHEGLVPSCYRLLANTYMFIGDKEKSKYYIDKLNEYGGYQGNIVNNLYGCLHYQNQEYDKALEYFNKVEPINKSVYYEAIEKIGFIYIKAKKYEEALKYFEMLDKCDNTDRFKLDCKFARVFLQKKLGMEITETSNLYSVQQMLNYSKESAIEHIKNHKEEKTNKIVHSVFKDDIDVESLYNYALEHISEENFAYNNFMDIYLLEYSNIGIANGKDANCLAVVTLPNSKDIITMYPYNKVVLNTNKTTAKVKKMSTIDKFKQKYGI